MKNIFFRLYDKLNKYCSERDFLPIPAIMLGIFVLLCLPQSGLAAESSYSDQQLIQMSEILHNKEKALDEKESLLREKERRLIVLQKELQKKEKDIETLRKRAETMLAELQALKDEDLSRLVAVYSAMKPAAAAPLMAKLDLPYAVEVILRMEPRKAAKLLSAIESKRAAAISRSITALNAEEIK
jgi:flagellar motility protein MotE (MotC chaperone)